MIKNRDQGSGELVLLMILALALVGLLLILSGIGVLGSATTR